MKSVVTKNFSEKNFQREPFVDPSLMVHPLRLTLSEDEVIAIVTRLQNNDDSITLEELECANDYLYDFIAAQKQTVYGVTTLQ